MSTLKGRLKTWDAPRGFGVIIEQNGETEVFFELPDFIGQRRSLQPGESLKYTLRPAKGGTLQAYDVHESGLSIGSARLNRLTALDWLQVASPLLLSILAIPFSIIPFMLYCLFSVICWVTVRHNHRKIGTDFHIPVVPLLVCEYLGGWPGSTTAQIAYSHHCEAEEYKQGTMMAKQVHLVAWSIAVLIGLAYLALF